MDNEKRDKFCRVPVFIDTRSPVHIFKDVEGYEGIYQVSQTGLVRSLDRVVTDSRGVSYPIKGRFLSNRPAKDDGYIGVGLSKDGRTKSTRVHILVAKAFVYNDNPSENTTVNHKDGRKDNNRYTNLEWLSYTDNNKHAVDIGLNKVIGDLARANSAKTNISRYGFNVALYIDGEIIHEAESTGQMANYMMENYNMGLSRSGIKAAVQRSASRGTIYNDIYEFIYTDNNN